MLIPSAQDTTASTLLDAFSQTLSSHADHETIRHLLFGSPSAIQATIRSLHKRGYADPNDWSRPISTGRPNEVMAILTKRIRLESQ